MMSASVENEAERPAYTEAHVVAYPVEYIAGIDLFNEGEFHAAHDAWEDRWMGEVGPREKLFLQAMIQSAVAFHHLEIGRPASVLRDARLLLIALWLGGAVFFSAAVAPAAFAVLRARNVPYANEAAGSIVTRTLAVVNKGGFLLAPLLLLS